MSALAPGILEKAGRVRVFARLGQEQKERSFAVGAKTLKQLLAVQKDMLAGLQVEAAKAAAKASAATQAAAGARSAVAGTVEDLFDRFLLQVRQIPSYRTEVGRAGNWRRALGAETQIAEVTPETIRKILTTWATKSRPNPNRSKFNKRTTRKPMKPQTIRHQLKTLRKAFQFANQAAGIIDDKSSNPARLIQMSEIEAPADPESREIEILVLARILHNVRLRTDNRARLALMATCGISPAEIARLAPSSIDFARGLLTIPARRKGKGAKARVLPIYEARGLASALRAFVARDCFGDYSVSSAWKAFKRACERAGLSEEAAAGAWRPYDARHTLGTNVARETGDDRAVQKILGHASLSTTERYTLGAADKRIVEAFGALGRKTIKPGPRLVRKAG